MSGRGDTMKLLKAFFKIWFVGTLCSGVPFLYLGGGVSFLYLGLVMGAPSVLLASIIITLLFGEELSK